MLGGGRPETENGAVGRRVQPGKGETGGNGRELMPGDLRNKLLLRRAASWSLI